ncbi:hypothetical protein KU855_09140 [Shewanella sp. NIFS-20-20]|nr:hypothetical protein [Shewanella sp. NIFS-20-20]
MFFCAPLFFLLLGCQPQSIGEYPLTSQSLYAATLSDDGRYAITSTADEGLQFWNVGLKKAMFRWHHGDDSSNIIATAISANSHYAASLARHSVALWRIDDGQSIGWWSLPASGQSISVADNGALLVGLSNGSVMAMAPQQSQLIEFLGHNDSVNAVAISANGKLALSGGDDRQVILWHTANGQPMVKRHLDSRVTMVALSHDGEVSFASDAQGQGKIWHQQAQDASTELTINQRYLNFSTARFSQHNRWLLTGTPARQVMVWSVATGKKLVDWKVAQTKNAQMKGVVVYSVAKQAGNTIVSLSSNGLVETWPSVPE